MDDILINFGSSVKAMGNGRIGGHLVTFGDETTPDLSKYGDFFEASPATDYDAEDGQKLTTYFHHGLDETLGVKKLGKVEIKTDDVGIWAEGVLSMRDEYEQEIYKMVEAGKLSWSSGATTHLVRREKIAGKSAHRVTHWPLSEASLTPTPADYRNAVVAIKSVNLGKNIYEALRNGEAIKDVDLTDVEATPEQVIDLLKGMKFADFLRTMGAVVEESTRRVSWHDAQRSIKQGRPISAANLDTLRGVRDGMKEHVGMLSDLITKHDPEQNDNETKSLLEAAESAYLDFLSMPMLAASCR